MNIWTLSKKLDGEAGKHLNGKLLAIKKSKESGHLIFMDVCNKMSPLWETTSLLNKTDTANGCVIETSSGSIYELMNVSTIIPTAQSLDIPGKSEALNAINERHEDFHKEMKDLSEKMAENHIEIEDLHEDANRRLQEVNKMLDELNESPLPEVVEESKIFRNIEYGNGYDGTVYKFADEITYDQFISFCKEKGHKLDRMESHAFYEDFAKIVVGPVKDRSREGAYFCAKNGDKSDTWTYLWVRAYTD